MPGGEQRLGVLAHDDLIGADDPVGQPLDRVQERAEVELVAGGERVQARAHRPVRGLEHAQPRLAAGAQQGRVRALVELDLVAEAASAVGRGGHGEAGDGHGVLLLHVRDAGGGRWPRAADDARDGDEREHVRQRLEQRPTSEKAGSRWASALEKPNSSTARERAARPPVAEDDRRERDEPTPAVMFWLNEPTNPIDR